MKKVVQYCLRVIRWVDPSFDVYCKDIGNYVHGPREVGNILRRSYPSACTITDCLNPEDISENDSRHASFPHHFARHFSKPCFGLFNIFHTTESGVLPRHYVNSTLFEKDVRGSANHCKVLSIDTESQRQEFVVRLLRRPWIERRMPCMPRFISGDVINTTHVPSPNNNVIDHFFDDGRSLVVSACHICTNQRLGVWMMRADCFSMDDVAMQASMLQYLSSSDVTPPFVGIGRLATSQSQDMFLDHCIITEMVSDENDNDVSDDDESDVTTDVATLLRAHAVRRYFARGLESFSDDWFDICIGVAIAVAKVNGKGVVVNALSASSLLVKRHVNGWRVLLTDFTSAMYNKSETNITISQSHEPMSDAFVLGCFIDDIRREVSLPGLRHVTRACFRMYPHDRPDCARVAEMIKAASRHVVPTKRYIGSTDTRFSGSFLPYAE